jgi:hypothetical protein
VRRVKSLYENKFKLDWEEKKKGNRVRKKMEKSRIKINVDFSKISRILSVSRLIFNTKGGDGITLAKRDELARSLEKYLENLPYLSKIKKRCKNGYRLNKTNKTKKNVRSSMSISERANKTKKNVRSSMSISERANKTKKNVRSSMSISEKRLKYRDRNGKLTGFYTRLRREIEMRNKIQRNGMSMNFVKKQDIKDIKLSEYMK